MATASFHASIPPSHFDLSSLRHEVRAWLDARPDSDLPPSVDVDIVGGGADSATFDYQAWAYGQDVAVVGVVRTEVQSLGQAQQGAATAEFFSPTTAPPLSNLPSLGSCIVNPVVSSVPRPNYSVGSSVSLSAGGSPFALMLNPTDNSYEASGLAPLQIPAPATYGLTGGIDPDGCPVDIPGIVQAAEPMVLVDPPPTMPACSTSGDLWCYFLQPDPTGQYQHGVTVGWAPGSAHVVLQMDRVDYYGDGLSGSMLCNLPDNGGITFGPGDLSGMAEGLYQFTVMRYRTTPQAHPRSGGSIYGTYMDAQIGYGWIFNELAGCYTGC